MSKLCEAWIAVTDAIGDLSDQEKLRVIKSVWAYYDLDNPKADQRSFEESYHAIRSAGGDAWDGLDVAKELAEIRGCDPSDEVKE